MSKHGLWWSDYATECAAHVKAEPALARLLDPENDGVRVRLKSYVPIPLPRCYWVRIEGGEYVRVDY